MRPALDALLGIQVKAVVVKKGRAARLAWVKTSGSLLHVTLTRRESRAVWQRRDERMRDA